MSAEVYINHGFVRVRQTNSGAVTVWELSDGWQERFHTYSPPNKRMSEKELTEYGKMALKGLLPILRS